MAEQFYTRRKRISFINIVPLIDVMTVLIFFFLMSMKFDEIRQLGITPPTAESAAQKQSEAKLVVAVNAAGEFFLNSEKVASENLALALGSAAEKQKSKNIILVADEETATKYTVFIVDQAQKHGLSVQLLTKEIQ